MRSVTENPSEIILFSRLDVESEPDQMIANQSADFNPDWIKMILLPGAGPCQIGRS